jgi:hypothetical protein
MRSSATCVSFARKTQPDKTSSAVVGTGRRGIGPSVVLLSCSRPLMARNGGSLQYIEMSGIGRQPDPLRSRWRGPFMTQRRPQPAGQDERNSAAQHRSEAHLAVLSLVSAKPVPGAAMESAECGWFATWPCNKIRRWPCIRFCRQFRIAASGLDVKQEDQSPRRARLRNLSGRMSLLGPPFASLKDTSVRNLTSNRRSSNWPFA